MDELDTQLAEELAAKAAEKDAGQAPVTEPELKPEEGKEEAKAQEAKTFDEAYVKGLRGDIARYRIRAREAEAREAALYGQNVQNTQQGYPQEGQPQQQGEFYDPRVDDIILGNKLNEIKADPYFSELFSETDDEGRTFEEKLLEEAVARSWPISELDALVFKMEKEKLLGKIKQKGIDEAYKSMSSKAAASADKSVSSGKSVEEGEVKNIDDAVKRAMKEHGVTNLSELR